ncbi:MAG: cation transporter [Lachnospiraceae bacterium]|nr:cation transporter [Lachnospiraceae bacterium]
MEMKKTYILEDLDCAHCAAEIEKAVGRLEGVSSSRMTFLTQKLVVEVEDARADSITKEIKKIVKKLEPDVEVTEK